MNLATSLLASAARPAGSGTPAHARVAVLGASGYSGAEFVRAAAGHPGLEITALVTRDAGVTSAADLVPGLDPRATLPPVVELGDLPALLEAGGVDTIVACLPHGAWRALSAEQPALAAAKRVVDLSQDHRDGSAGYLYGLPEAFRNDLQAATRVANPGCYPTATLLALLPAARHGWLAGPVVVSAISGASGAGRGTSLRTSFVELDGGAAFYKVGTGHAHVAEMSLQIARLAGSAQPAEVAFAPQLVPMARGILVTVQAPLATAIEAGELRTVYEGTYADEPFVRLLEPDTWPATHLVRGSNRVDVQATTLFGGTALLATAAIDNVAKGAATQAIQNLNLMLGWPETTGLSAHGRPW